MPAVAAAEEFDLVLLARLSAMARELSESELRAALQVQAWPYQAAVDRVPDHLWVKDVEGRYVVVNKALASSFGRARASDMIGLTDFDLLAPATAAAAARPRPMPAPPSANM